MARPVPPKLLVMVCAAAAGACQFKVQPGGAGPGGAAGGPGAGAPFGPDRYNSPSVLGGPIEVVAAGPRSGEPLPARCAWRPWVVIKDHAGGGTYKALRYPRNDEINNVLLYAVAQKIGYGEEVPCERARRLGGEPALMKAARQALGKTGSILAVQWIDGFGWEVLRDDNTGAPIQQVRAVRVTYDDSRAVVPPAPAAPTPDNLEREMGKKIGAMIPAVGDLEYRFGPATIDPKLELEWTDHYAKADYVAHASFVVYQRQAHERAAPWQPLRCGPITVILVRSQDGASWEGAPFGGRPRCGDRDECSVESDCVPIRADR